MVLVAECHALVVCLHQRIIKPTPADPPLNHIKPHPSSKTHVQSGSGLTDPPRRLWGAIYQLLCLHAVRGPRTTYERRQGCMRYMRLSLVRLGM